MQFDPPYKNRVNFDPLLKSSQFRSPLYIQVNLYASTQTRLISIQILKQSHFDPHKKLSQFRSSHEIKSSSIPHIEIKPISTTHTKTRSTSMLTLKPSAFRPACKNQVNFDHTQKPGQSISKLQKKSFSARTRKAVIAILALKPSQFRSIYEN